MPLIRLREIDINSVEEWCWDQDIKCEKRNSIVNPRTFEVEYNWFIEDEKDCIMFILKFRR